MGFQTRGETRCSQLKTLYNAKEYSESAYKSMKTSPLNSTFLPQSFSTLQTKINLIIIAILMTSNNQTEHPEPYIPLQIYSTRLNEKHWNPKPDCHSKHIAESFRCLFCMSDCPTVDHVWVLTFLYVKQPSIAY